MLDGGSDLSGIVPDSKNAERENKTGEIGVSTFETVVPALVNINHVLADGCRRNIFWHLISGHVVFTSFVRGGIVGVYRSLGTYQGPPTIPSSSRTHRQTSGGRTIL